MAGDERVFRSGLDRFAVGPARLLVDVLEDSVSHVLGRELAVTFGTARARLRPRAVRVEPTAAGLLTGRLDTVDVELDDVRWSAGRLDALHLRARQTRVEPGLQPTLVTGPIDVHARLGQATLDDWLASIGVEWGVRLGGDGWVEMTMPGRAHWGHAVMRPAARGATLTLVPEEVVVRGRRVRRPVQRFAKPVTLEIPPLPGPTRILSVHPRVGELEVRGVVDELREPFSLRQLRDIQRAAARVAATAGTAAAELALPRLPR
jgi:hypothetical protein